MKTPLLLLFTSAVMSVFGIPLPPDFDYTTFDATTGFDVHTVDDAYKGYSGGAWLNNWTSGGVPTSGTNYYSNGYNLYAPKMSSGSPVFPGDLLALDALITTQQASKILTFTELLGLGGGQLGVGSTGQGVKTTGDFSIRSSEAKPFSIARVSTFSKLYAYTFEVGGKFRATPESLLDFIGKEEKAEINQQWLFTFKFPATTDVSEFYGKVRLTDASVELDSANFGGTFEMTNAWVGVAFDKAGNPVTNRLARLYANACDTSAKGVILHEGTQFDLSSAAYAWHVGDLTANGGDLLVKVSQTANQGGTLTVTNAIALPRKLRIVNTAAAWKTVDVSEPVAIPLIVFAAEVDLSGVSIDDFELDQKPNSNNDYGTFPIPKLALRESGDGTSTLYLTRNKIVRNIKIEGSVTKAFTYGTGSHWSDGQIEHGGVDYWLGYNGKQPQYYFESNDEIVFPAENLLAQNGEIFPHARLYVTNLVFGGGMGFHVNAKGDFGINGRLGLFATSSSNVNPSKNGYTFEIASEMYGPGVLLVRGLGSTTFSNSNTNYSGRIEFSRGGNDSVGPTYIRSGTSLGGAMDSFTYNGVLMKDSGTLVPLVDLTIDVPTRGYCVGGEFSIDVPESRTLTMKSVLTYAGTLTKSGKGTLVLASVPRFIDGEVTTDPLAGTNELVVVEGAVRLANPEALNGLAVTVQSGAELHFAAQAADEWAGGLKMTRTLSALAPAEAGGRIRVMLDVANGQSLPLNFTQNIATFATEAEAQAACGVLDVRTSAGGYRARLATVAAETGYAVQAEVYRTSMILLFK